MDNQLAIDLDLEPGSTYHLTEEFYGLVLQLKVFWQDDPRLEDTQENRDKIKRAIEHLDKAYEVLYGE